MSIDPLKKQLLDDANFHFQFDMGIYFNRDLKKFFSEEAINDHELEWIRACISEGHESERFYFNQQPDEEGIKNLLTQFYPERYS